jgi:hypothetical protein
MYLKALLIEIARSARTSNAEIGNQHLMLIGGFRNILEAFSTLKDSRRQPLQPVDKVGGRSFANRPGSLVRIGA